MEERGGLLSRLVSMTDADPSLAQDLLEATDWDLEAAVAAYKGLSVTTQPHQFQEPDFSLNEYDEIQLEEVSSSDRGEEKVKKRSGKKKMLRGLTSVAEEAGSVFIKVAVSEAKLKIGNDQKEQVFDEQFFKHSFLRPDFSTESQELQKFIDTDIIETSHKHTLQDKLGRLNWWSSTGKLPTLEPLATSGDGNCLLHAASLYMWGLPDQNLVLRTHLHRLLSDGILKEAIRRRWQYLTDTHNQEAGGLIFSEEEWEFEWSEILRICTNQRRRRPTTDSLRRYSTLRPHYESLEEVHVFGLSHVLRRPVIVVADEYIRDMNGEPLAPVYFGGIYLPLECSPSSCFKSPLVLAYDSSHFSPLVARKDREVAEKQRKNSRLRHMQSKQDTVMPLVDYNGSLLPLLFAFDPEKPHDYPEKWVKAKCDPGEFPDKIVALLESYMDIRWIQLGIGSKFGSHNEYVDKDRVTLPVKVPKVRFPAAVVSSIGEPEYQAILVDKYLENVRERFEEYKIKEEKMAANRARQEEEMRRIELSRPVPCRGKDCTLYGTPATDHLCSQCYSSKNTTGTVPVPTSQPVPVPTSQPVPPPPTELIIRQSAKELDPLPTPPPPPPNDDTEHDTEHSLKATPTTPKANAKSNAPPIPPPPHVTQPPSEGSSAPSVSHGYSRDNIKPVTFEGSAGKNKCRSKGCDFYGGSDTEGYCSRCYNSRKETLV